MIPALKLKISGRDGRHRVCVIKLIQCMPLKVLFSHTHLELSLDQQKYLRTCCFLTEVMNNETRLFYLK